MEGKAEGTAWAKGWRLEQEWQMSGRGQVQEDTLGLHPSLASAVWGPEQDWTPAPSTVSPWMGQGPAARWGSALQPPVQSRRRGAEKAGAGAAAGSPERAGAACGEDGARV